eukprot:scaffold3806_cov169-Amphora_coffeaeformis.AAC.10
MERRPSLRTRKFCRGCMTRARKRRHTHSHDNPKPAARCEEARSGILLLIALKRSFTGIGKVLQIHFLCSSKLSSNLLIGVLLS